MKKGGGALMHVYVWEHIVSLYYRTTQWMFTKLGMDEVLMSLNDLEACGMYYCYFWFIQKSNFLRIFDIFLDLKSFCLI